MKILLDENIPHELRLYLAGHQVSTVTHSGWNGIENGELLAKAAEAGFEALITQDARMQYQHNPATLPIAVVILKARGNGMPFLRPLVPRLLLTLVSLPPKGFVRLDS